MTDHDERWRDVIGYGGFYQVSDRGRLRSRDRAVRRGGCLQLVRGRALRPSPNRNGVLQIMLRNEGERASHFVHRLVALAFVPGHSRYRCRAAVLDGDYRNLTPGNLRWLTRREHADYLSANGLGPAGERNARAKLTAAAVRSLRRRTADGEHYAAVARDLGMPVTLGHARELATSFRSWKGVL